MPDRINRQLFALLNQGRQLDIKLYSSYEKDLIGLYKKALDNIRAELSSLLSSAGDNATIADIRAKRLQSLYDSIQKELTKIEPHSRNLISKVILASYKQSYGFVGYAVEKVLQQEIGFGSVNEMSLKAALFNPYDKIKWDDRNRANVTKMISRVRNEITNGLIEGKGYVKTAAALTEQLNIGVTKAVRIAWTETHRAQESGRLLGIIEASNYGNSVGLGTEKFWDATLDSKTRTNHGHMESEHPDEKGRFKFVTMKGLTVFVDGPGMTGTTDDINCRCTLSMRFKDIPLKVRRDNENGKIIPYKTYDEWAKNRLGKTE